MSDLKKWREDYINFKLFKASYYEVFKISIYYKTNKQTFITYIYLVWKLYAET